MVWWADANDLFFLIFFLLAKLKLVGEKNPSWEKKVENPSRCKAMRKKIGRQGFFGPTALLPCRHVIVATWGKLERARAIGAVFLPQSLRRSTLPRGAETRVVAGSTCDDALVDRENHTVPCEERRACVPAIWLPIETRATPDELRWR